MRENRIGGEEMGSVESVLRGLSAADGVKILGALVTIITVLAGV